MTDVVLFHHAHGLTDGVLAFADDLRAAGHQVTTPDLYEGEVFDTLEAGIAHAEEVGFAALLDRGRDAVDSLPDELVYAGFSLGVLPAQMLAQTRPGARGAVLMEACVPPSEFDSPWPPGVPLQVHGMEQDPFFAGEGDLVVARELVEQTEGVELFLYAGYSHLFADQGLPSYDADAATLLTQRVVRFLDGIR